MGWISPNELYADPKLWLSIDHQFHESLGRLMKAMFPDWQSKLQEIGCHCFKCEGKPSIPATTKDGKKVLVTGYVERPEKLLRTIDV